ncbi:MAG: SUMF1/EgtB/PvdO family nonheme iron enzyme [Pirellulaceae bacterium]
MPAMPCMYPTHVATLLLSLSCIGAVALAQPSGPSEVRDGVGQTYRLIPAAHFEMGSSDPTDFRYDHVNRPADDARPWVAVILTHPYYMATTEVTVGQFRRFVEATGHVTTAEKEEKAAGIVGWQPVADEKGRPERSFAVDKSFTWRNPGYSQTDEHPVVGVSHDDAVAYCQWLSKLDGAEYQLPTEAQWEHACRAGTTTHFSFGDQYRSVFQQHANFADTDLEKHAAGRAVMQWLFDAATEPGDGHAFTAPVGSYRPNAFGLHDMHGNVWEWCRDSYLDTFYQQFDRKNRQELRPRAIDPICTEKWNQHGLWQVIRGGSWYLSPMQCRSGTRGVFNAKDAACYLGFRVCREVPSSMKQQAIDDHQRSENALKSLSTMAAQIREYDDMVLRIDIAAERLGDDVVQHLRDLNYAFDVSIRPPGNLQCESLATFAELEHMVGLGLATYCPDIDEQTFAMLANHPQLRRLQLTGSGSLTDAHVFPFLEECEALSDLHLHGEGITDDGLLRLPKLQHLRGLHVGGTSVTGRSLSRFKGSPLETVTLEKLSDEGASALANFPLIRQLHTSQATISAAGLDSIASLPKLSNLSLSNCQTLDDQDLALLGKAGRLQQLQLQRTAAGDATALALIDVLSLRNLQLGSHNLTDRGVAAICQIVSLHDLIITADADRISNRGFDDLWRLVNLRRLSIETSGIDEEALASIRELPELQQLTLPKDSVSSDWIDRLQEDRPTLKVNLR